MCGEENTYRTRRDKYTLLLLTIPKLKQQPKETTCIRINSKTTQEHEINL